MDLVIIEGPGKRETLKKYLGSNYDVVATKGHIIDLPIKTLAIDINNNFEPNYVTMPDKEDIINDLKKRYAKCDNLYIATDPDREGEAIAWHVERALGISEDTPCRIEFNEISKDSVNKAIKMPRKINMDLVHAQQGRRVLDRLVGYKVSPIICKKIKSNLSGGRVQSVALKLVVDREKEIKNFKPVEYWSIVAELSKGEDKIKAALATYKKKKYQSGSAQETNDVIDYLKAQTFVVGDVKKTITKSSAPPPFTTSTMQQDALNKINMSVAQTSRSAQQLYEGVEIKGEGKVALITYIRTDSTRVSPEAQAKAKDFIIKTYGADYAPEKYNVFKAKKNIQDAHEAIRPISLERTPESLKGSLSPENYKLYKLIYERFVASQMSDATYNSLTVNIDAGDYGFKVAGKTPLFLGYTKAYKVYTEEDENDEKGEHKMCNLEVGDVLKLLNVLKEQKFTKPPVRYTEASLIKAMEEKGIGRPATYAPTMLVLSTRNYTEKDGKYLVPTELGTIVTEFMEKYFKDIMDVSFTAAMEDKLDGIEEGNLKWQDVVADFYSGFEDEVYFAATGSERVKVPVIVSDVKCDKCGAMMVIKEGRYGKFLACPKFPNCRNTKQIDEKPKTPEQQAEEKMLETVNIKCDKCGKDMVLKDGRFGKFFACSDYPNCKNIKNVKDPVSKCPICGKDVFERKSKYGKIFYGCSGYPKCNFASWDMPTNEKCPKCSSYLTKKTLKDGDKFKCSNKECDYQR